LHMLCKVVVAARTPSLKNNPSWIDPVIQLFDQAVSPWGKDFDILYAPVSTNPDHAVSRRNSRWSILGEYWHFVLFSWNTQFRKKVIRLQVKFDKWTLPFLDNVDIAYSYRGATLAGTSRPLGLVPILAAHSIFRPADLFTLCEPPVTPDKLSSLLRQFTPGRISSVRSCANFLDKVGRLLNSLVDAPIGPHQAPQYFSAYHTWAFDTYELADLTVARIRSILFKPEAPGLPLRRLGIDDEPPDTVWKRDLKMGKHVLPVYADFLYRLQHNALFLGYRLQHLPQAECLCPHECAVLETAPHLFWFCSFALQVWSEWISAFQGFFSNKLEWESVLFFKLSPTESAKAQYGYSLFAVLHIVRVVIFRNLWMHRNDIRFHGLQTNLVEFQARVNAVVKLHIERYHQDLLEKNLSHSGFKRRQLQRLLDHLPLPAFLPVDFHSEDTDLEENMV
ncbi:hypothetical protein PHMEG_00037317, partial [Phytophthora megakarya]